MNEQILKLGGHRLKLYRKHNNMLQEDFSNELNTTQATISNIEIGKTKMTVDIVLDLKKKFNINVYELYNDEITDDDFIKITEQSFETIDAKKYEQLLLDFNYAKELIKKLMKKNGEDK